MGALKIKRVPAATLVETIVALIIILVLFSITVTILVQASLHSPSFLKLRAVQLINQVAAETTEEQRIFDEEIVRGDLRVYKRVEIYGEYQNLVNITFTVLDSRNKELITERRFFKAK